MSFDITVKVGGVDGTQIVDSDGMQVGDLVGCTCGPYHSIVPPGPCPHHSPQGAWRMIAPNQPAVPQDAGPWMPLTALPLSDADVERIAQRVVELLKEAKP